MELRFSEMHSDRMTSNVQKYKFMYVCMLGSVFIMTSVTSKACGD